MNDQPKTSRDDSPRILTPGSDTTTTHPQSVEITLFPAAGASSIYGPMTVSIPTARSVTCEGFETLSEGTKRCGNQFEQLLRPDPAARLRDTRSRFQTAQQVVEYFAQAPVVAPLRLLQLWQPDRCDECELQARLVTVARAQILANKDAQREATARRDEYISFLATSGIPAKSVADINTFEPAGESLELRRLLDASYRRELQERWLLVLGPKGCGKSTECARILIEAAKNGSLKPKHHSPSSAEGFRRAHLRNQGHLGGEDEYDSQSLGDESPAPWVESQRYVSFVRLHHDVKATYDDTSKVRADDLIKPVLDSEFLVLDDVGTETATPHALELLFIIIDHRYGAALPTVITSNCQKVSELVIRLAGERGSSDQLYQAEKIVDRIRGMARVVTMERARSSFRPLEAIAERDWSLVEEINKRRAVGGRAAKSRFVC